MQTKTRPVIKNKVIVFGCDGNNALGLVRSLGQMGLFVVLLLCGKERGCVGRSKYVKKIHFLPDFSAGIDILKGEYANEEERPIVFPAGDHEVAVLDANYNQLKDRFILFNAKHRQGGISYYLNKVKTFPLAERNGLNLIKTWVVNDISRLPCEITYPCIIKSNNCTIHNKEVMFVCENIDELNANLRQGVEYLIQEYIKREHELCIVGVSFNGGEDVYLPAVVRKIGDGLGPKQSTYIRLDDVHDYPKLDLKAIRSFVKELGYEGILSVEVLFSHEKYYFLEINLRNDGCCYLYTKAGINYPYLWTLNAVGKLNSSSLCEKRFRHPYYLMSLNYLFYLLERKISILRLVRDFLTVRAFYVLSLDDPMPFVFSLSARIIRVVRRKLKNIFAVRIRRQVPYSCGVVSGPGDQCDE